MINKSYKHKKGYHHRFPYDWWKQIIPTRKNYINCEVKILTPSSYISDSNENQSDWNKLIGFSSSLLPSGVNKMLVWRYYKNKIEFGLYENLNFFPKNWYNPKSLFNYLTNKNNIFAYQVLDNQVYPLEIKIVRNSSYSLIQMLIPFEEQVFYNKLKWLRLPWFGGNESSPINLTLNLKYDTF